MTTSILKIIKMEDLELMMKVIVVGDGRVTFHRINQAFRLERLV
jgi:hypothetical protein